MLDTELGKNRNHRKSIAQFKTTSARLRDGQTPKTRFPTSRPSERVAIRSVAGWPACIGEWRLFLDDSDTSPTGEGT